MNKIKNIILSILRKIFWSPQKLARFNGVKIGHHCNIQNVTFGSEPYLVEIGNHVQLTNGVKIFTHGGAWIIRNEFPTFDFFGKVCIKSNVYVGANAMILPGVTIGNNVIIGAGSVVTKSIPDGKIAAGNPARIIGDTKNFIETMKQYDVESKAMNYKDKKKYLLNLPEHKFIQK